MQPFQKILCYYYYQWEHTFMADLLSYNAGRLS